MTQENRQRKHTENSQERYYKWPINTDRCSGPAIIRAVCEDHTLRLGGHPSLLPPSRHTLPTKMKFSTEG